jgi:hypothetical protein
MVGSIAASIVSMAGVSLGMVNLDDRSCVVGLKLHQSIFSSSLAASELR